MEPDPVRTGGGKRLLPGVHRPWFELLRSAERQLEHGRWLLRLSAKPSFDTWRVIGITNPPGEFETYIVQARSWDLRSAGDSFESRSFWQRLRRPSHPKVAKKSAPLPQAHALGILRSLRSLHAPIAYDEDMLGLDGTTYELQQELGMHRSQFRWWSRPPEGWEGIAEFWESTWRKLAKELSIPTEDQPRYEDMQER